MSPAFVRTKTVRDHHDGISTSGAISSLSDSMWKSLTTPTTRGVGLKQHVNVLP